MSIEIVEQQYEIQEIIKNKVGVVRNILNQEECNSIIARSNVKGFTKYDEENRLDKRDKFEWYEEDNSPLAQKIFNAIKPILTPNLPNNRVPIGIRDKMRLYKYEVGEVFSPHVDGGYAYRYGPKTGQSSVYTYVIYLNGKESGLEGGSTNFFDVKGWPEEISTEIEPEIGKIVVFQQKGFKHEGGEILKGVKYIIQGMVMYSRPTSVDDEGKLINLPIPVANIFELVPVSSRNNPTKWRSTVENANELNLTDHQRYLIMMKAGHSLSVIRNSMMIRGVKSEDVEQWIQKLLDEYPSFLQQKNNEEEEEVKEVEKKEVKGNKNSAYYRMLKAGIPKANVKQRMMIIAKMDAAAAENCVELLWLEFLQNESVNYDEEEDEIILSDNNNININIVSA